MAREEKRLLDPPTFPRSSPAAETGRAYILKVELIIDVLLDAQTKAPSFHSLLASGRFFLDVQLEERHEKREP